jgi:pimeloyl-ACP methyl ester carboxylesterase
VTEPSLRVSTPAAPTRAIALVLHGGRADSTAPTSARQLAVLRMAPFARSLRAGGSSDGLAVARLRYLVRGWNGDEHSPVADTEWALDELGRRFPGAPVAVVGHSMGGRAALYAAGHPGVVSIVALAPWIEREDPVEQLAGRRLLVVHGAHDRMTSARRSAGYARAAASVAASVSYVRVDAEAHAMLRRAALWHRLTTGFVLATLLDRSPPEPNTDPATKVLREALAGEPSLVV